jgi:hypothetical protein
VHLRTAGQKRAHDRDAEPMLRIRLKMLLAFPMASFGISDMLEAISGINRNLSAMPALRWPVSSHDLQRSESDCQKADAGQIDGVIRTANVGRIDLSVTDRSKSSHR